MKTKIIENQMYYRIQINIPDYWHDVWMYEDQFPRTLNEARKQLHNFEECERIHWKQRNAKYRITKVIKKRYIVE